MFTILATVYVSAQDAAHDADVQRWINSSGVLFAVSAIWYNGRQTGKLNATLRDMERRIQRGEAIDDARLNGYKPRAE
jgi:hypothetical protein